MNIVIFFNRLTEIFNSLQVATDLIVERDGYKGDFSYGYTINII